MLVDVSGQAIAQRSLQEANQVRAFFLWAIRENFLQVLFKAWGLRL
jgi:hypothetical protein